MGTCTAAELFTHHMLATAKLAALFFCQPAGGPAVPPAFGGKGNPSADRRDDGYTRKEASFDERVRYWANWCPAAGSLPTAVFGTHPFSTPLATDKFPAVNTGTGDGARHSLLSPAFIEYLEQGDDHEGLTTWVDSYNFLPRLLPFIPGMPPKGGAVSEERMRAFRLMNAWTRHCDLSTVRRQRAPLPPAQPRWPGMQCWRSPPRWRPPKRQASLTKRL